MRKRTPVIGLVVFAIWSCSLINSSSRYVFVAQSHATNLSETPETPAKETAFDVEAFYNQINTDAWRRVQIRSGRGKRLQLPLDTLQAFDTETLAKLVYLYPFNIYYMAFNRPEMAFEHIWNELTAMRVLAEREDAILVLDAVSKAHAIDAKTVNEEDEALYAAFFKYQVNERALGIVMAQPVFALHTTAEAQVIIETRTRNAESIWRAFMYGAY